MANYVKKFTIQASAISYLGLCFNLFAQQSSSFVIDVTNVEIARPLLQIEQKQRPIFSLATQFEPSLIKSTSALAQESSANSSQSSPVEHSEEQAKTSSTADEQRFIPSEEISEDLSVSFPVDI
jgi:hypothetical protein